MARSRADELLVARGLYADVAAAARAIYAGDVTVDTPPLTSPLKPGTQLPDDATVRTSAAKRFVSRGGEKLEGALRVFGYDVFGVHALDAGASTGGFTDCLLQRGAASVSAVDVGYGQLAWSLRTDPRVVVHERTNIRTVDPAVIGGPFDLAVADLSFISLGKVAANVARALRDGGDFIALVKPQFEAAPSQVGAGGVVENEAVHRSVLAQAARDLASCGLAVEGLAFSPITGPEGNIEFWIRAEKVPAQAGSAPAPMGPGAGGSTLGDPSLGPRGSNWLTAEIERVVTGAHDQFRGRQ